MTHVLLESNWVVEVCAPAFRRTREALDLLAKAARNEVALHVPAIALREARAVIRRKYQAKEQGTLQAFRRWAVEQGLVDEAAARIANDFLTSFANSVNADLDNLDARIREIEGTNGVHVFALDESMLDRALNLRTEIADPELKPFDEAILAAVLVRAAQLPDDQRRCFCTLDTDLSPVDRRGVPRPHLRAAYEALRLEVRTSFDIS